MHVNLLHSTIRDDARAAADRIGRPFLTKNDFIGNEVFPALDAKAALLLFMLSRTFFDSPEDLMKPLIELETLPAQPIADEFKMRYKSQLSRARLCTQQAIDAKETQHARSL